MRIRTYLVLMAPAILLPVVLAAGLALERIRNNEREMALRGLRETVRATALLIDREAQGALSGLKVLAGSTHFETGDFRALRAQAMALNQLPDVWTIVFDEKGRQVVNTRIGADESMPDGLQAEMLNQVQATQKPVVSDLRVGKLSGKLRITINVPVHGPGGRPYMLTQAFAATHWAKTVFQAPIPSDWIVAVIDREGNFVARSHLSDERLGKPARPELVAAAAKAFEGLIVHPTLEGIPSYDAFTHSSLTGWTIAIAAPVASIHKAANRALLLAGTGVLLAVLTALLTAAIFGRRFIRAIEGAGANALSMGRGEIPRIEPTAIHEVDVLNQRLLDAGTLLGNERKTRMAAEAERERLLRNETLARETAQAQNLAKDRFLALLGHELRNPLAAISGATALLHMEPADRQREQRALRIIARQNMHLSHIVNDLLDASRLLTGKIVLELQPLNLAECVSHCADGLRASERAAGYRIEVHADDVWVNGDLARIEQILSNLMSNALKFSPPGGKVEATVRAQGAEAVVSIQDGGVGMSAELLPHVFEPFVQGPPTRDRMNSGMGIGLALVEQLVALHGGSVAAASPGTDQGSTFTVRLPAIPAPALPVAQQYASPNPVGKLVYVEDNQDARETTSELLSAMGYQVVAIAEGAGTLATVLVEMPDAVVLDIGLPDMDGHEVARRLRANAATRAIPLIALSGYGMPAPDPMQAAAGFDVYLVKPVDIDTLAKTIEQQRAKPAACTLR